MNISKPVKILIGCLTVLVIVVPFLLVPAFMMFFIFNPGTLFFAPDSASTPFEMERTIFPIFMIFYPLMMCDSFIQLGLQVFYLIHEIKNKALDDTYRILFAIGTFFLPYIALPIYFFVYLWKDKPQESQAP